MKTRRELIVILALLMVVPAAAQSLAILADGTAYVPIRFLPDDLKQSVAVDTPGYATLQGTACLRLSDYAAHVSASISYDGIEKQVKLSWWNGQRTLQFYALPLRQGLDVVWGLQDMQRRGDQPLPGGETFRATCTRVVDGDTVELSNGEKLRYIGIDTPEMDAADVTQKAYAELAQRVNRGLVEGVDLTVQLGVEERDRYGRLLGYVWADNTFVNGLLMASGFAQVMTYPPNIQHAEYFRALGAQAREANRGLWSISQQETATGQTTVQTQPVPQQSGMTVYVTRTGSKYHRGGCRYLRQSKIAMSLAAAKAAGYTPCKVCSPPR